jgi:hypothetical protein
MIASRTRAMTLLGLAFVLGLIVGGGVIVQAVRSGNASWIWRGRGPGRGGGAFAMSRVDRLHLNLDQATKDSIGAIACRGMAAMDSLRLPLRQPMSTFSDSLFQTIQPAVQARREQTRTEIRALLPQLHQERYDSMNRADDEQRKKMRDQGGPPPGGGPCTGSSGGPGPRGGFDRGSR